MRRFGSTSFEKLNLSRVLGRAALVALVGVGALGCEVQECDNEETGADGVCLKSLKRFEGDSVSQTAAYSTDLDVVVLSVNGDVTIGESSDDDELEVTFEPFVLRAYDTPRDEAQEDIDELLMSITQSNRGLVVDVDRPSGTPSTLGADIWVGLPSNFAAVLDVDQQNGSTDVGFVAAAAGVIVTSDNGSCDVETGYAERVSVHCDNGDLRASVSEIAPQTGSGFSTGNGSIELSMPSDGYFYVEAVALAGGSVIVEGLPEYCVELVASESSKTVSCNGGTVGDPVYVVTADGTSLADVVLRF